MIKVSCVHEHETVNKLGHINLIHMKMGISHFRFLIVFCPNAAGELTSLIMGLFLRSSKSQTASSLDKERRSEVSVKQALKS